MQEIRKSIARSRRSTATCSSPAAGFPTRAGRGTDPPNSSRAAQQLVVMNSPAIPDNLLESRAVRLRARCIHRRGEPTGRHAALRTPGDRVSRRDRAVSLPGEDLRVIEMKEVQRLGGRARARRWTLAHRGRDESREPATAHDGGPVPARSLYRLSVTRVDLPPLRQRIEDISLLTLHCVGQLNRQFDQVVESFTPDAFEHLMQYPWPGNVRGVPARARGHFCGSAAASDLLWSSAAGASRCRR